jgi:transglutaminase-like putative cysteine protease
VESFAAEISPTPAWQARALDYFGNPTEALEIGQMHDLFEVRTTSRVSVDAANHDRLDSSRKLPWEAWVERLHRDPELVAARELCFDSPLVRLERGLRDYALSSFQPGRPLLEAIFELNQRIHDDLVYDKTVTDASTPLANVLRDRRGVCQDFAHFAVGCMRSVGLAACYVSGYLETRPPPGRPRLVGADASHAWASAFLPDVAWFDFDPTNALFPEDRHITLCWGRDFSDVSPLKGVVHGGGGQRVVVQVDVEAVGEPATASEPPGSPSEPP